MKRMIRDDDLFTQEDLAAIDELTTLGVLFTAIYEESQQKESWLDAYLPTLVETAGRKLLDFADRHHRKVCAYMFLDSQENAE